MKKILSLLLVVLTCALLLTPAVLADGSSAYIFDESGVLTQTQKNSLNQKAEALSKKRKCAVYIWLVDFVPEEYSQLVDKTEEYIDRFYEENNLGWGDDKNGMVLLLETGDDRDGERNYQHFTFGPCIKIFNKTSWDDFINDELAPMFKDAYSDGSFYDVAETFLDRVSTEFVIDITVKWAVDLGVVILIPMLIAWLVCSSWKRKMKTAVISKSADNYIPANGFNLTGQSDTFLYRTTTRVKIVSNSSSGGGSSGRSSSGSSSGGRI